MNPSEAAVDRLIGILLKGRFRGYGPGISEETHALQCATRAGDAGEPREIIAACLLHDLGRLLRRPVLGAGDHGFVADHEQIGAEELAGSFGPEVSEPVRLHTEAKRYLSWREPAYVRGLGITARRHLAWQGGPMTDAEALEFEVHPHFAATLRVRRYDDASRGAGYPCAGLEAFRGLLMGLRRGVGPGKEGQRAGGRGRQRRTEEALAALQALPVVP